MRPAHPPLAGRRPPPAPRAAAPPRRRARPRAAAALRVVVTGGTRGIGRALVDAFLRAGDDVVFCGRSPDACATAAAELAAVAGAGQVVAGVAADVGAPGGATALAAAAVAAFGGATPDAWINNAGVAAPYGLLAELADDAEAGLAAVVATNVVGSLLGTRAALRLALAAPPPSATGALHVFNMDGAGSDGGPTPAFAAYGASKAALTQLHRSLRAEIEAAGLTGSAAVHRISPGMVTTQLLMDGADRPKARWFINALAEPADASAAFLVPRVRAAVLGPAVSGPERAPTAAFLTRGKALAQIAAKALFGARKDLWVVED